MSKKGKHQKRAESPPKVQRPFHESHRFWVPALILANLIFFWTPLTSPQTSIQWDAADYYWVVQKYFSDELHAGRMPFWTPYVWSGYPFLADPQVGAWYPLNWPFFAMGVSPRTIQVENFLHSLLACLGTYFLVFRLLVDRRAAFLAGLVYGLCGWFVGHSSHTTMVEAAAWLPWLLLSFLVWQESRRLVHGIRAILIAGLIVIAGHFQTTLYCFLALGLFALALCFARPSDSLRLLSMALLVPSGGTLLSAVHTLPGLELVRQSTRAFLAAVTRTEGFIRPDSLLTLIYPNYFAAISGKYWGPPDVTQYYFYAGLALVPLAVAGLTNKRIRWMGLMLFIVSAWYAAGFAGGLYYLMARLPGFSSVRAPVNIWFVPTLGLAMLTAAGFVFIIRKWPAQWLPWALLVFTFCDLWYWNSAVNPLAYARYSYDEIYGLKEESFQRTVGATIPPLTRFLAPEALSTFGPMSHPLDTRVEATYGYGPLKLQKYSDFISAMSENPKLKNDLNVSLFYAVRGDSAVIERNADLLTRANFPKQLIRASDPEESKRMLLSLDPAQAAIVPREMRALHQDPAASVQILDHAPGRYHMRYHAGSDSLLRVSVACYPGWQARVDGASVDVFCVDHTLTGVVVPAGNKELLFTYHPTYFAAGSTITLTSLAACIAGLAWARKRSAVHHEPS
jgi:hypothetical protein